MVKFKGPVRPGESESIFRETGETVREVRGPVRPGTDEEVFRRGGRGSERTESNVAEAEQARKDAVKARKTEEEKKRKEEEKKRKEDERKAKEDAITKEKLKRERLRIDKLKFKLIRGGAKRTSKILTQKETGEKVRQETLINTRTGERVFITTNLETGEKKVRTFETPKGGGLARETGGLVTKKPKESEVKITSSDEPNRKLVTLPSGLKFKIASTGIVNVGKAFAGRRLQFVDGQLVEEAKRIKVEVKEKKISERFRSLSAGWEKDVEDTKIKIRNANKNNELEKLKELQKLGSKATAQQKAERARLFRSTSKNYELGGEMIGKVIGSTLINMGLGTVELLKALRSNPVQTLVALPPAVFEGVKADFERVMSGDPLEIGQVGLEYYTFSKVFNIAAKAGKVPIAVGRTLSPKYFSGIAQRLTIPPATLRGVVRKTAAGRRASSSVKKTLKEAGVIRRVNAFNNNLRKSKSAVNKRLDSIKQRSLRVKRRVKRGVAKRKAKEDIEIKKFKSREEFAKDLKRARRSRKLGRKKGRTLTIGNDDYVKAIDFIEEFADRLATLKAKRFVKEFKKRGGKIGLGKEEDFIRLMKTHVRKTLNELPDFKRLQRTAKLNEPFQIKLRKQGKVSSAKKLFKNLSGRINNLSLVKTMNSIIRKTVRKTKRAKLGVKKGVKKVKETRKKAAEKIKAPIRRKIRRIKKKARVKRLRKAKLRAFKQTNRYRMDKARPIRKVTINQLRKAQTVGDMNRFIDKFFNELGRRQKIDISTVRFKQLKNITKKRVAKAIRTGNQEELRKFAASIKKLADDMNKRSSNPDIRVIERVGKTRRIRTIKDFKPEGPQGSYAEVKSGQQILLQRPRQVQVQKVKLAEQKQVFIIQSVSKKSVNLKTLLDFMVESLSALAFKNFLKTKQDSGPITNQNQLQGILQDSAQDFRTLQVVAQDFRPRLNVALAILQKVRSKQRQRFAPRLKTKLVQKKKKAIKLRLKAKKNFRILKKRTMAFNIIVRRRGKAVRLKTPPLILTDAKDLAAFNIDRKLIRTAKLVPVGLVNKVGLVPKAAKGYYGKKKKKFRTFRIKKGKKLSLTRTIIENKKFIGDTKSEIRELQAARRKSKKRKVMKKRKVVKKKKVKRKVVKVVKKKRVKRRKTTRRKIKRTAKKKGKSKPKKKSSSVGVIKVRFNVKKKVKRKVVKRKQVKRATKKPVKRRKKAKKKKKK